MKKQIQFQEVDEVNFRIQSSSDKITGDATFEVVVVKGEKARRLIYPVIGVESVEKEDISIEEAQEIILDIANNRFKECWDDSKKDGHPCKWLVKK